MTSFMFTGMLETLGSSSIWTEKPVASCRWDAEGSWPHCHSGKEEETEGGISTWCLGQGGHRLRGSDIWWVSSKGSSSFWPEVWLVCVRVWVLHKYGVSAKTSVYLLFPFPAPYSIFLCVYPSRILSRSKGLPWSPKYEKSVTQNGLEFEAM